MMLVGVVAAVPFLAGACQIDIGGGCALWIQEPGVNFGLVCN